LTELKSQVIKESIAISEYYQHQTYYTTP